MADTSNLTNYLKDIAKAIKAKKGTTDPILAANFDIEIETIETNLASAGVKLFSTVDEMEADTTAEVGDLAVVYNYNSIPITPGLAFRSLKLNSVPASDWPKTGLGIVLESVSGEITSSLNIINTGAYMTFYTPEGTVTVVYGEKSSTNMIAPLQINGPGVVGTTINFGQDVYFYDPNGKWNSGLSEAFHSDQTSFEGLFVNEGKVDSPKWVIATTQFSGVASDILKGKIVYSGEGVIEGTRTKVGDYEASKATYNEEKNYMGLNIGDDIAINSGSMVFRIR